MSTVRTMRQGGSGRVSSAADGPAIGAPGLPVGQTRPLAPRTMRLRVVAASGFQLEDAAVRIVAEAENGSFCLLPRHRDFATSLVPGLFEFTSATDRDHFLAIDEGLLVKTDDNVSVCTRHAVQGDDLASLKQVVDEEFALLDDRERAARAAVARLEADFARRFLTLREHDDV